MNLDLEFYGTTKLKDWWKKVKSNFETITNTFNSHTTATELNHPEGSVYKKHMASDSVGTEQVESSAITEDKIALSAITTDKIKDGNVTRAKLHSEVQTQLSKFQIHIDNPSQEISDGAVTHEKLDVELQDKIDNAYILGAPIDLESKGLAYDENLGEAYLSSYAPDSNAVYIIEDAKGPVMYVNDPDGVVFECVTLAGGDSRVDMGDTVTIKFAYPDSEGEFGKFFVLSRTRSDSSSIKVDSELSSTSENPLQNKVVNEELNKVTEKIDISNSPVLFSEFSITASRTDIPFVSSYDVTTGTLILDSNGVMGNWSAGNLYEKCFSFEVDDVPVAFIFAQDNDSYYYLNITHNDVNLQYFGCFQKIVKSTGAESFIGIRNTYLERNFEQGEKILMTFTPNLTVTVNETTKTVNRYVAYRKRVTDVCFRQFQVFDLDTTITPVLGFYSYNQLSNVLIKGLYIDVDMPKYPVYNGVTLINNGKNDSVLERSAKKWLAIGDSITGFGEASWGDGAVDATDDSTENSTYGVNYINFVEAMTGYQACRKDITGNNYGYSGYALGGSGDHGKAALWGMKSEWDEVETNLITLFAGTNDYYYGTEIGTIDDYINNTGIDTIYGALRLYIDYFKSKGINDELDIVLITPIQRFDDHSRDVANSKGYYLSDYVDAIKAVGAYEGLAVVDLYNDGGIGLHNYTKVLKSDYLHPNKQGYEIIAKRICAAFKYGNTQAILDLQNSSTDGNSQCTHTTTPTQIGTWIDGTPIWRVSFDVDYTFSADVKDSDGYYYPLNEVMNVDNTNYASILECQVFARCGAPCLIDDVVGFRNSQDYIYFSSLNESMHDGVYGYVDFICAEDNLK